MPVDKDTKLTLIDHLLELCRRLLWVLGIWFLCFFAMMPFAQNIYTFIAETLSVNVLTSNLITTEVITSFFVPIKVTLMTSFLLTLPHTLFQIWAFIAPGLYQHEKRLILPLVIASVLLFLLGMAFVYYLVLPIAFKNLIDMTPSGVSAAIDIDKYLSFVLGMFVAFGVTFEIPVLVILLNRRGSSVQQKRR